jgi:formylglycine-generating enzyme required for sulfatase activity
LARRWTERDKAQDLLLRGRELDDAVAWASRHVRIAPPVTEAQRTFLAACQLARVKQARRRRQMQAALAVFVVAGLGYAAWASRSYLVPHVARAADLLWPKTLSAETERSLKSGDTFKECTACPEMVVIPAGEFAMGSPATERGNKETENPAHPVALARAFAASRFDVT